LKGDNMKLTVNVETEVVEYKAKCKHCGLYESDTAIHYDYNREILHALKEIVTDKKCAVCGCNLYDVDISYQVKVL